MPSDEEPMSEDGIRKLRFLGDAGDPEATRAWASDVVDTMEEIYKGPVPALPRGAQRHDLVEEVLHSDAADWEIGPGSGDPNYFSWVARHRLNSQLRISIIGKRLPDNPAGVIMHLMIAWHRRLVITDSGILVDDKIVLPHPNPKDYYSTNQREQLWRTIHVIRELENEYDLAASRSNSGVIG